MKKTLSTLTTLLLFIIIIWSVSSWYFGREAEKSLRSLLRNNTQLNGENLITAELTDYKRTWVGANAILRFSSDNLIISERFGEYFVKANLLNGPVFLDDSGFSIGTSKWIIQPDVLNLSEVQLQDLKTNFPEVVPYASVRLDFKQKAHYVGEFETETGNTIVKGVVDLITENNRGSVDIKDFQWGDVPSMISAKNLTLSFQHQKDITEYYDPATANLYIPDLKISHEFLDEPLLINLKATSNILSKNNNLSGLINVEFNIKDIKKFPVKNAVFTLEYIKLVADTFLQFTEAKGELDNLQQQTQWLLEEQGEVPEGQDQIWQLQDQIKIATIEQPIKLMKSAFNNGESQIKLEIESHNNSGGSTLNGVIRPADSFTLSDKLLSYLKGEAKVNLDDELFEYLNSRTGLNKKQFLLSLKQNKLLMQ